MQINVIRPEIFNSNTDCPKNKSRPKTTAHSDIFFCGRLTPASKAARGYLAGLKKESPISLVETARRIKELTGYDVSKSTLYRIAQKMHIQVRSLNDVNQTEASKKAREYIRKNPDYFISKGLSKTKPVSLATVIKILKEATGETIAKITAKKIAEEEGFKTCSLIEALQTEASKKARISVKLLVRNIRRKGFSIDEPIHVTRLVELITAFTGVTVQRSCAKAIAVKEGFKFLSVQEASQTDDSRKVRRYVKGLVSSIRRKGFSIDEPIYVARLVELIKAAIGVTMHGTTTKEIALEAGFKVLSVQEANKTDTSIVIEKALKALIEKAPPGKKPAIISYRLALKLSIENPGLRIHDSCIARIAKRMGIKIDQIKELRALKSFLSTQKKAVEDDGRIFEISPTEASEVFFELTGIRIPAPKIRTIAGKLKIPTVKRNTGLKDMTRVRSCYEDGTPIVRKDPDAINPYEYAVNEEERLEEERLERVRAEIAKENPLIDAILSNFFGLNGEKAREDPSKLAEHFSIDEDNFSELLEQGLEMFRQKLKKN